MASSGGETAITYRSGERVELGDIVMEPVNGDMDWGVVLDVILPNSEKAMKEYDGPSGGVVVKWDSWESWVFIDPIVLQGIDEVFFVRRKNEMSKPLTYRGGERVELGDIVMRSENGDTTGVVVVVFLAHSWKAVWNFMRLGGVFVKWDGCETEVSMEADVLREEVCLIRRKSV